VDRRSSVTRRWGRRAAAVVAVSLLIAGAAPAAEIEILEPVEVGTRAPDFTLPDTSGTPVRLSEFAGKVVLLTFWSCYTDTCFTTVKVFEDLLAKLGPLGLVAPTICEEIPPGLAAENYAGLLQRCSTGQKILVDLQREVRGRYRVRQLPTSVLIGPDMKILEIVRGVPPLRDPAFHERVEKAVRSLPR
jgi:cytochrome c biogenesis protein CcmG, thiol:disulfide interchange protein DsbE